MQILDPKTGLSVSLDLPRDRDEARAPLEMVPVLHNIICVSAVRNDSGLRNRNGILSRNSGDARHYKNNISLRYNRYCLHYYWKGSRYHPGSKP
jgi:hypothetical protein